MVNLNALVRRAVLALALIVVVMVIALATNTRKNMANIFTDVIGGISNLWTRDDSKEPTTFNNPGNIEIGQGYAGETGDV